MICYRSIKKLVKTVFKRSKGHAVRPLERLTSKSSSTRYLKKYLSDRYEILTEYSNRHGELLYSFGE